MKTWMPLSEHSNVIPISVNPKSCPVEMQSVNTFQIMNEPTYGDVLEFRGNFKAYLDS